ncbi:MAG: AbrB/MazE/SpoVT family DNA-binding domain-containing protein, partial [Solirubrobacterales bacterium]
MRITSKGQVTIPKPIRDRAGLLPGTDVEFAIEDEKVTVRRSDRVSSRGADLIAHLR